jgi:quinol monooxygenase YgiN
MQPGFYVLYRWRLHDGKEAVFERAWETITLRLRAERGALGSRLHRASDGTWAAYAAWPDRSAWERSRQAGPVDERASSLLQAAILESEEPLLLEPVNDRLV